MTTGNTIDLEVGQKQVYLRTGFGNFRFEVWEGGIDREVWDLLKSLETPITRDFVMRPWKVTLPFPFGDLPNAGPERRFVVFSAPDRARVVLRCSEGAHPLPISRELHMLLKTLDLTKETDHEATQGQREDARAAGRALEGGGPGDRPSTVPGLDAGAGQEGKVAPARRPGGQRDPFAMTDTQRQYLEAVRAAHERDKKPRGQRGGPGHRRGRPSARRRF